MYLKLNKDELLNYALPCKSVIDMKFIDIAVNLTDEMFKGIYHGKIHHAPDYTAVLNRAFNSGIRCIFITGTSISESSEASKLCNSLQPSTEIQLYFTAGIHPTNSSHFTEDSIQQLANIIDCNRSGLVAFGEFGLDYERLQFACVEQQQKCFRQQLRLAKLYPDLPLFLHNRKSTDDLIACIREEYGIPCRGVVHSFDGTLVDLQQILDAGLYVSLNGCSLRSEENLQVVKEIPLHRLLLETDAPWCQIRKTHSSFSHLASEPPAAVKYSKYKEGSLVDCRNEPCCIKQIAEVVANLREMPQEELSNICYQNTIDLFFCAEKNSSLFRNLKDEFQYLQQ